MDLQLSDLEDSKHPSEEEECGNELPSTSEDIEAFLERKCEASVVWAAAVRSIARRQ
jgi:hypothetical protein